MAGGCDGEVVEAATLQAQDGAGRVRAVAVEHVAVCRLGSAKVLHGALAGVPGQQGRAGLTLQVHFQARGLTGH